MGYEDNIFDTGLNLLFQENFDLKNFTAELEDKKGTYYRWIKTDLERRVNNDLSIIDSEFTSDQASRFKKIEKVLLRSDSIKILRTNDKASLFNGDINLGIRYSKVLQYLEKKCKEESQPRVKRGKINLSPVTAQKYISDILNNSKLQGMEYAGLVDMIRHKWNSYSKYIVEMERMLFYLQSIYREKLQGYEKDHEKKGLSVFDLKVSGKKKYSMFDHKTRTIVEKEDHEEAIEYVLFVFAHSDSKNSAYKDLLSEMHESTKSSYHRSAEGEKEALAKLENISISSSDIQEILKYIGKIDTGDRELTHMDFDSAIKFFFILGENFFENYMQYAESLFKYYGKSLGSQIRDIVADVLGTMEESATAKKRLEDYTPSPKLLREWEDTAPLRGNRIVLLTLPKFIIAQHIEFTKPLINMMGFISSMTDNDFEIKNKFYEEIMNHPYMKRLNSTVRRKGIQREIKGAYSQLCSNILMIKGKQKLYIEELISKVMKDHRIDDKLFTGLKPIKIANTKKNREKELAQLLEEQEHCTEKHERDVLEASIKKLRITIKEDELHINKSEIDIVKDLFLKYTYKFVEELNKEEERYYYHNEGSYTYITKRFSATIDKEQKKQIQQKEYDDNSIGSYNG